MNDAYRLARLVDRLAKSETYRSNVGGVAYVDIRLLDEATATAKRVIETRKPPVEVQR